MADLFRRFNVGARVAALFRRRQRRAVFPTASNDANRPSWRPEPPAGEAVPTVEFLTDLEIERLVRAARAKPQDRRLPLEQCVVQQADQIAELVRRLG